MAKQNLSRIFFYTGFWVIAENKLCDQQKFYILSWLSSNMNRTFMNVKA